ncbi:hypothetical protein [Demequina sediminicola]|uniref:hypothetical protein n=1 Tax=Demequina sediminicola TaxID=1095026 RepID=UPI000785FB13|nr:hypothetical protein [Demequina sediminicola]
MKITQDKTLRNVLIGFGVAVLVAILAAMAWFATAGFAGSLTVADLLTNEEELNPVEDTAALCGDLGCVEAWRTDSGNFLEFASEESAEHWALVLGDEGRRWEQFVLDMREVDLSFEERENVIAVLYNYDS